MRRVFGSHPSSRLSLRLLVGVFLVVAMCAIAVVEQAAAQSPARDRSLVVWRYAADEDLAEIPKRLTARLTQAGEAPQQATALPASLDGYRSIWWADALEGPTASEVDALAAYVRAGGGLYLSGEWDAFDGSFNALNGANTTLLRALLTDKDVTAGGVGDVTDPYSFVEDAVISVARVPNALTVFNPARAGGISGVNARNVFLRTNATTVGAAWDGQDMTAGRGRVVLVMDVNWLQDEYGDPADADKIVQNIANFLGDGPPPPPATPAPESTPAPVDPGEQAPQSPGVTPDVPGILPLADLRPTGTIKTRTTARGRTIAVSLQRVAEGTKVTMKWRARKPLSKACRLAAAKASKTVKVRKSRVSTKAPRCVGTFSLTASAGKTQLAFAYIKVKAR